MAMATSRAEVRWQGDLRTGSGELTSGSGVLTLPLTFQAREQPGGGRTNPEELIASAHAACYAMAFSHALAQNQTPASALRVAAVSLDRVDGALKITRVDLSVDGEAAGTDAVKFEELARAAEQRCPVSNALRGNVEIRLRVGEG
jgi:osmotically inducible protein OsmC